MKVYPALSDDSSSAEDVILSFRGVELLKNVRVTLTVSIDHCFAGSRNLVAVHFDDVA